MSKQYFCKRILEAGYVCGEKDIKKFEPGRYTVCKACRLKYMSDYNKNRRNIALNERMDELDPDKKIRAVVEDTIVRIPLLDGKTIQQRMDDNEEEISNVIEFNYVSDLNLREFIEKTNKTILVLQKRIEDLEIKLRNKD